ncbi:MAG: DNA/RNA nuclease SfsA [Oscillatoriales cyanobacterium RM1_1_9]|nr:DNA/RNA nuclease SfsA [Oscillatoriales cyanobacterium RM1_1_9]
MPTSTDWLYRYPPLYSGILIKRYQRFLADIQLDSGEIITAHCPNTGPMTGVCTPGSPVQVSHSSNPKRKLAYTWEMIQVQDTKPTWVGINTALPNLGSSSFALEQRLFPELGDYQQIRSEVPYGQGNKSRVDFLLAGNPQSIYLEVKNTTWAIKNTVLFPDTVTERGQKHLRELSEIVHQGDRAVMLYLVNRGDCTEFAPGDTADPLYGQLLRTALTQGVEILSCQFQVTPGGVKYLGLIPVRL